MKLPLFNLNNLHLIKHPSIIIIIITNIKVIMNHLIRTLNHNSLFLPINNPRPHCGLYRNEDVVASDHLGLNVRLPQPADSLDRVVL